MTRTATRGVQPGAGPEATQARRVTAAVIDAALALLCGLAAAA